MIVEIEEDIIKIKGHIKKNLWPATLAAADMIIGAGYKDIIVDCSEIKSMNQQGIETFASAFSYLSKRNLNLYFVSVNEEIVNMAKTLPGIRSSMPIADSVAEIRQSIEMVRKSKLVSDKKYLFFPVIGNPSHAVVFSDIFQENNVEINFIYPMIIPMKYNLYQPIKFLENKVTADLNRLEGLCIFLDRQINTHVFRIRSFDDFFERINKQFRDSFVFLSFARCDFERNQNKEKLSCYIKSDVKGLIFTEPKNKPPFVLDEKYNKILVVVNDNETYKDRVLKNLLKKIISEDSVVEFVKLNKLKINESPKENLDYIENFQSGEYSANCKTVNVRLRSRYLLKYVNEHHVDFLILPAEKDDDKFILTMCEEALCSTLFVK